MSPFQLLTKVADNYSNPPPEDYTPPPPHSQSAYGDKYADLWSTYKPFTGGGFVAHTDQQKARDFVRSFNSAGKPIAAICHAPWVLVSSGVVQGRTLTSWSSVQDDIRNAGGNWVDQQVVRDNNWVTSRSPQDLEAFNPAIVELFAGSRLSQTR